MKSIMVKFNLADDVKNFVQIVEKYDFEVDLRCGRHVVNAKSLLGIFSLNLNEPLVMEVFTDDCNDLINEITPFIA